MQHANSSIIEYYDNVSCESAIDRGERLLYGAYVLGFGVSLNKSGPYVPSGPISRQEAEDACAQLIGQFPDAKVGRVGVCADAVAELQEDRPGDYFHISYIAQVKPGHWGNCTDMHDRSYEEALDRAAELRVAGYTGAQLERVRQSSLKN